MCVAPGNSIAIAWSTMRPLQVDAAGRLNSATVSSSAPPAANTNLSSQRVCSGLLGRIRISSSVAPERYESSKSVPSGDTHERCLSESILTKDQH